MGPASIVVGGKAFGVLGKEQSNVALAVIAETHGMARLYDADPRFAAATLHAAVRSRPGIPQEARVGAARKGGPFHRRPCRAVPARLPATPGIWR